MRVNDDYKEWNVAAQLEDLDSVWSFWKEALSVRKAHDVLVRLPFFLLSSPFISPPLKLSSRLLMALLQIYGEFKLVAEPDERVFAFTRTLDTTMALVVLNFTDGDVEFQVPKDEATFPGGAGADLLISNYPSETSRLPEGVVTLRGFEGSIYVG